MNGRRRILSLNKRFIEASNVVWAKADECLSRCPYRSRGDCPYEMDRLPAFDVADLSKSLNDLRYGMQVMSSCKETKAGNCKASALLKICKGYLEPLM